VLPHALVEPLRQRPGLHPDPLEHEIQLAEPCHQRIRLARNLGLAQNLPGLVHDAYADGVQRNVDPCVVLHPALRCLEQACSCSPSATPSVWRMTILTAYAAGPPVTPSMPSNCPRHCAKKVPLAAAATHAER